jgi:hypothetical protein
MGHHTAGVVRVVDPGLLVAERLAVAVPVVPVVFKVRTATPAPGPSTRIMMPVPVAAVPLM